MRFAALLALAACGGHLPAAPNPAGLGAPAWPGAAGGTAHLAGGAVSPDGELAFVVLERLLERPGFAPLWTGGGVVALALAPLGARWRLPLPARTRVWDWVPGAHALWASRADEGGPAGLFALRPGGMIEPPRALADGACGRIWPIDGGHALLALADGGRTLRYWRRDYADYAVVSDLPGPAVGGCAAIAVDVDRLRVAALIPLGTMADPRYGVFAAQLAPTGRVEVIANLTLSVPTRPPEVRLEADALSLDGRWLALRAEGTGRVHEIVVETASGARVRDDVLPDTASPGLFAGDVLVIPRESGLTRSDLGRGETRDDAIPGCCLRVERAAGLLWAQGTAGGVLVGAGQALLPVPGSDGHFAELGGDLYDLAGAKLRRTRPAAGETMTWPAPAGVDSLLGIDPVRGELVLAGLDAGSLHVVSWSPERGVTGELALPLARVLEQP